MFAEAKGGKRCVIWFGHPEACERMALTAAGWQVRAVLPQGLEQIGIRGSDTVVGLVDFRHASAAELEWVMAHMASPALIPLLALMPSNACPATGIVKDLLQACSARFSGDDLKPVLEQLRALGDAAFAPSRANPAKSLLGESPALMAMRTLLHKYAAIDLPVLVSGETGTGKELAAHALHQLSQRRSRPILAVNCGAISSSLLQSELFGHEKGAFTGATARRQGLFESADGGTVFLDEVGDLLPDAQTSLLRVLQEGTIERLGSNQSIHVDVRIVAASHVDLEQAVEAGRFRRDLYYRLNVLRLPMPALRERNEDVELLAEHFLASFRAHHAARARGFSSAARRALREHTWPGNVRELLNRVQRAAVTTEADLIECADLELPQPDDASHHTAAGDECNQLLACLAHSGYNISACARRMRVSRVTVYRMCHRYGVHLDTLRTSLVPNQSADTMPAPARPRRAGSAARALQHVGKFHG